MYGNEDLHLPFWRDTTVQYDGSVLTFFRSVSTNELSLYTVHLL